jgi:hypothetical protein
MGRAKGGISQCMGRAAALLVLFTGCSTAVEIGQECPTGHPVCDPVSELESPSASPLQEAAPAPEVPPLGVVIETSGVAAQQISLSCETPCVFVKAVAHGGTGPYAFVWEDGSTEPGRQLCPAESARHRVTVTDADPLRSVSSGPASAEIDVLTPSCPDVENAPTVPNSPPIDDTAATRMTCETLRWQRRPADWSTRGCAASIWTLIPRRVQAGRPHRIQARGQGLFEGRWRIELWGSPDGCMLVEKLGEFSVAQTPVDTQLEFQPQHDHEMLVLSVVEEMDSERWRPYLGYTMCTFASATP